MLTKIPRQPFLIPLDTSQVWLLMRKNTNIQDQKRTEDLLTMILFSMHVFEILFIAQER